MGIFLVFSKTIRKREQRIVAKTVSENVFFVWLTLGYLVCCSPNLPEINWFALGQAGSQRSPEWSTYPPQTKGDRRHIDA